MINRNDFVTWTVTALALLVCSYGGCGAFVAPRRCQQALPALALQMAKNEEMTMDELKSQLVQYLDKRRELGADERAKEEIGKVIGGSKGNAVLEWISLAPNKGQVIEAPPNALDYDELEKYGFGNLSTPMMNAGGRFEMYKLLGMSAPEVKRREVQETIEIVIDRTGEQDEARYSGLKMGLLNDEVMGEALAKSQQKAKDGQQMRNQLTEETFVKPFADKRNIGPKTTPEWTARQLDEELKRVSASNEWARKERELAVVKDPYEKLDLELQQRAFSVLTTLTTATAFGRSTPTFLVNFASLADDTASVTSLLAALQVPALALVLSSIGSSLYCALISQSKNRSLLIWMLKGLLGGPLTVRQLAELPPLVSQAEQEQA